ncbi:MAG: hypothetical protein HQL87_13875 [Magnetococcales bacterium]|nr:hypothetical protein [Magnetococcales bacterium]
MKENDLFQFYEKLYFHEIDSREKLNSRLQTPLTLIISLIGVHAFLLQNYGHSGFSNTVILFTCLVVLSAATLVRAIVCFVKSWHNNEYVLLPAAQETEEYRRLLDETYESYDAGNDLSSRYFLDYLLSSFIRCSSENTQCNDRRSIWLHKTNTAIIATTIIVFCAFLAFFFGDLDKDNVKKITEVSIVNPITLGCPNRALAVDRFLDRIPWNRRSRVYAAASSG